MTTTTYQPSIEEASAKAQSYADQRHEIARFTRGVTGKDLATLLGSVTQAVESVRIDVILPLNLEDFSRTYSISSNGLGEILAHATYHPQNASLLYRPINRAEFREAPASIVIMSKSKGRNVMPSHFTNALKGIEEMIVDKNRPEKYLVEDILELTHKLKAAKALFESALEAHGQDKIITISTAIAAQKAINIIDNQLLPALEGTKEQPGMQSKLDAFVTREAFIERHSNQGYINLLASLKPEAKPVVQPVAEIFPPAPPKPAIEEAEPVHPASRNKGWVKKLGTSAALLVAGAAGRDLMDDNPMITRPFRGDNGAAVQKAGEAELQTHRSIARLKSEGPKHPHARGEANTPEDEIVR